MTRNTPLVGFLAAAALGFAPAAAALQITNVGVVPLAANTADGTQNTGNNRAQNASTAGIAVAPGGPVPDTAGSSTQFEAVYRSIVAADREGGGVASVSRAMASAYQITFTVDNPTGATYQLDIDTLRIGAFTVVDDDAAPASEGALTLGAVSGTLDGVADPNLGLAAIASFSSSATGTSVFNQSSTTFSLTDSALSRTFVLTFGWTSNATSSKDEAAIRMGTSGSLSTTTADDYPGIDGRTAAGDGHFVTVVTTIVPEPGSAPLVALGLLGIAVRARKRLRGCTAGIRARPAPRSASARGLRERSVRARA